LIEFCNPREFAASAGGFCVMAMEMHVFYRGRLPSRTALNKTMQALDLPLAIVSAERPLERHKGFMPMRWRAQNVGVELDVWTKPDDLMEIGAEGVDPRLNRSVNLRWTGDRKELFCAESLAAALAKLTAGVVFEPEEGRLLSLDEAIAAAQGTAEQLEQAEPRPPSTSLPYLKRQLKPLLDMRSDLMLRGRFLFIRPVRHLLRGAHLDAVGINAIRISRRVGPLYGPRGYGDDIADIHPWQPYFAPWLLDLLREDVFDHVGQLTTLSDLVDDIASRERQPFAGWFGEMETRIVACVLAGERDRAEAYLGQREGTSHRSWIDEQRAFLDRDITSICEEYHAKEATIAQALDLGDAWEPSPFPIELPKPQRASRPSETPLVTVPWVATPPGVVSEPPDQAGKIAFARDWSRRKGRIIMVAPLTCEEAQAAHENEESYSLFSRLPGRRLLVLSRETSYSPHNPEQSAGRSRQLYCLRIHGPAVTLRADFTEEEQERGNLKLAGVSTINADGNDLWSARNGSSEGPFRPWNDILIREQPVFAGQAVPPPRELPFNDAELALCSIETPRFGAYADLLDRTYRYLELCGYNNVADWNVASE
jgi:hypothetical protein